MPKKLIAVLGVFALAGAFLLWRSSSDYEIKVVMPSATNLVKGSPVKIDGFDAGKVKALDVRDGKAVITVAVDDKYAPLPEGTTAHISWKALLGERLLDLTPGPSKNKDLESGALVESSTDRVEVDQLLATLDTPTRAKLTTLLKNLDSTASTNAQGINATLAAGGPAIQALGEVLRAVGEDGPAIRNLVTRMNEMSTIMATRQDDVSEALHGLQVGASGVADRQADLRTALQQLPGTLDQANETLGQVPTTVKAASPLLDDLAGATSKLPAVSKQLAPVMTDLRPVVARLRPTLDALAPLLNVTPALLDGMNSTLPQLDNAIVSSAPALDFLRPYTPELAGWISNWASAAGNYDANGHYLRAFFQQGPSSLNVNPGVLPPGMSVQKQRLPGQNEKQPWTDANGSTLR